MAEGNLITEIAAPLATLRLNRPTRRNALSTALMSELITALQQIAEDERVAVVIIEAEGPVFSSGHDLTEMIGRDLPAYRAIFERCTALMTGIHRLPQPVIAQVRGLATAAGCQLVAACDLVVASESARFATPGVKIGLFCSTPMVELSRAIGRKRALEMLLTGRAIDAATARDWGLVNRVVPDDQLAGATRELAAEIAQASSLVTALGKKTFYEQIDLDQPRAYSYATEVMSQNALAADAQEGISAFLDKRKPNWSGR